MEKLFHSIWLAQKIYSGHGFSQFFFFQSEEKIPFGQQNEKNIVFPNHVDLFGK